MWSSNWEQVTATLSCLFFFFSYFPSHNSKSFNITTGCCFFFCVTPLVNSSNDFAKILVSSASSSTPKTPPPWVDVDYTMQLYHHPFSVDSQKVRLALEENGIDYTSYHINPLTGKNMEASFFRMNPSAKLPVFQNGSHIICNTIEIIQYIERIAAVSSVGDDIHLSSEEVIQWMHKIQQWNPKYFTLLHVPEMPRLYVSKFIRRVVITRMAEFPDLASAYHFRLRDAYDTEEKLKDLEVLRRSKEELVRLLDEVEAQLKEASYLAGEEFTMADVMLMPILARLMLLKLEDEYINNRPNIAQYWNMVQKRASYKKVIGKYFDGWRSRKTLMKTWCFIHVRSMLRKY